MTDVKKKKPRLTVLKILAAISVIAVLMSLPEILVGLLAILSFLFIWVLVFVMFASAFFSDTVNGQLDVENNPLTVGLTRTAAATGGVFLACAGTLMLKAQLLDFVEKFLEQ